MVSERLGYRLIRKFTPLSKVKKSEVSVMTKDCYARVLRSSSAMKKALFLFIDLDFTSLYRVTYSGDPTNYFGSSSAVLLKL